MTDPVSLLASVMGAMNQGPRRLGPLLEVISDGALSERELAAALNATDPNSPLRAPLRKHLSLWDYAADAAWADGTAPNTRSRRDRLYQCLDVGPDLRNFCEVHVPVYMPSDPLIVLAEDFEPWYTEPRRAERTFYWDAYAAYLQDVSGWNPDSVGSLSRSTIEVVEKLTDPERVEAYPSKGLVVGYVQSGKTANFTGVLARAADAGYRLFIVMSGTMNLLRRQTQRRIDKELIGRELLLAEAGTTAAHDYVGDDEWLNFVSHSQLPSSLGAFDWQRLTGPEDDYQALKRGIAALQFERVRPNLPFYSSENLHHAKARLIVVKKNSAVLRRLAEDLDRVRTRLGEVPALIIDDESDQASINTHRPTATEKATRTAINSRILDLLDVLPRGQYVGYTATPFANVFVDPDDASDIFPKDFIVSLERPQGYMGARDFHDFDDDDRPEMSNARAHVRSVRGLDDRSANLQRAIDSFVVAGAIKLYREDRGCSIPTKHHTMLIHTSSRKADHDALAVQVRSMFTASGYSSGSARRRIERLLSWDFGPVAASHSSDLPFPASYTELRTFLGACIDRVQRGESVVLVVNGDNELDTPDFDRQSIWKILVGGAKLSRGYTVEGLTTSYYRRRTLAADTLMQMGRWFGYRPNYGDLVRLFVGRAEGRGRRKFDLYQAFEAACRDEEDFRAQLTRYVQAPEGVRITPRDVPPLVASSLPWLRPTSTNKMFNATIASENFGSTWIERTVTPTLTRDIAANVTLTTALFQAAKSRLVDLGDGPDRFSAYVGELSPEEIVEYAQRFRWAVEGTLKLPVEFLEGKFGDPLIRRWVLITPQITRGTVGEWTIGGAKLMVVQRSWSATGTRFKAFTEPRHRRVAEYVAELREGMAPNQPTAALRGSQTGVMLLYPVRDLASDPMNVGFALLCPSNNIPTRIQFTVRRPDQSDAIVVKVP